MNREQIKNEYEKKAEEIMLQTKMEHKVIDNKIEIEIAGKKYRVRKPTFKEKIQVQEYISQKYNELLDKKDENGKPVYLLEEEIKAKLKERGIDFDALDKEVDELLKKAENLSKNLGELFTRDSQTGKEEYEEKLIQINRRLREIEILKIQKLGSSIESLLTPFSFCFMSYLVTEVLIDDKWKKPFDTYKEFESQDPDIINNLIANVIMLTGASHI